MASIRAEKRGSPAASSLSSPSPGPRDAVYLVYVFGCLGPRFVAKRLAVCLPPPPPADLADGEASGSRSGLVSFSSPSALGSAKTANQPPCCYTERRGGANETGEIQTVTKSIRLFLTLETPSGPALGFFQSAVSPDDDIILHGGGKMKLMMSRTRLQQIEAESGSSTIHSSPPLTENLAGSSACRNSLLPLNRLKAGNANSRSLPLPRLPVVISFHGRRETYASLHSA